MEGNVLVLAIGGGGDAIAAHLVGRLVRLRGKHPVCAGLAWERLIKDPLPGPRRLRELSGLDVLGTHAARALAHCAFPSGARTNQARLVEHFGDPTCILDPWDGVTGLANGLRQLDALFHFEECIGVDVGGDVLAGAPLATLSSPLADAMMLSALAGFDADATLMVAGLGADGEIPDDALNDRLRSDLAHGLIKDFLCFAPSDAAQVDGLLRRRLLDSEVNALVVKSYLGLRGKVKMRDRGAVVEMGLKNLPIAVYRASDVRDRINPLVGALSASRTLDQASAVVERMGFCSELKYERNKASRAQQAAPAAGAGKLLPAMRALIGELAAEGADFVSERYLAEKLGTDMACAVEAALQLEAEGMLSVSAPFLHIDEKAARRPPRVDPP
jgi:hypothetical protein